MYYLTEFLAPDPFLYLKKIDSEPMIVVNQMEYHRAEKESIIKDVRAYSDYNYAKIIKTMKNPKLGFMKFIAQITKQELGRKTKIYVPPNFPVILVDILRNEGLNIIPMFGVIEKARETKESKEIQQIEKVQKVTEETIAKTIKIIADTKIANNKTLNIKGKPLTVGLLTSFFRQTFLDNECITEDDIIVACGPKTSDPHYRGKSEDILKANQPIILDIYPRSIKNRYWSDMTRTIVKGKASKNLKHMFNTVFEAKNASFDAIKAGTLGSQIFDVCSNILEKSGYETTRGNKIIKKGMTHSLGHGVGLEIHENPRKQSDWMHLDRIES